VGELSPLDGVESGASPISCIGVGAVARLSNLRRGILSSDSSGGELGDLKS
jgi:hypothetical protein